MKRPARGRDGQQWIYDYILKTTGRAVHFEMDGRNIPIQAKSIRMVSKHLAGEAEHAECLAKEVDKRGDIVSAGGFIELLQKNIVRRNILRYPSSPIGVGSCMKVVGSVQRDFMR